MNENTAPAPSLRQRAADAFYSHAGKVAAAGALMGPGAAFAQADLAGAVTAEVDTAQLIAVGVVVMTIAGILLFIRSGRRATGG